MEARKYLLKTMACQPAARCYLSGELGLPDTQGMQKTLPGITRGHLHKHTHPHTPPQPWLSTSPDTGGRSACTWLTPHPAHEGLRTTSTQSLEEARSPSARLKKTLPEATDRGVPGSGRAVKAGEVPKEQTERSYLQSEEQAGPREGKSAQCLSRSCTLAMGMWARAR